MEYGDLIAVWDYGVRDERRQAQTAPIRSLQQTAGVREPKPYSVKEHVLNAALRGVYTAARMWASADEL